MQIAVLYVSTAFIFLALDAVMLKTVMRPLFDRHIGDWLLEDLRIGPAVGFYLLYVGGVVWFASLPAIKADAPLQALLAGALLGALAYGTYEFTNFATLRNWTWEMVAVDLSWGILVTGISAWAGVMIARLVN